MEFKALLCRTSIDLSHLIFSFYIQTHLLTDHTGFSALAQIVISTRNPLPSSLTISFLSILWKWFSSNFISMKTQPTIPILIYSLIQQIYKEIDRVLLLCLFTLSTYVPRGRAVRFPLVCRASGIGLTSLRALRPICWIHECVIRMFAKHQLFYLSHCT